MPLTGCILFLACFDVWDRCNNYYHCLFRLLFHSKSGPWTKSQAGLVSCREPWKNIHWAVEQNKCFRLLFTHRPF